MREECFSANEIVESLEPSSKKSEVELRLYNHKTDDVFYKRLTPKELMKVVEALNVEGFNE